MIRLVGNNLKRIKRFSILLFLLIGIILIPVSIVLLSLFTKESSMWIHIKEYLLKSYIWDTLILSLSVLLLASLIGVATAWIVVNLDFPFKKTISIFLLLPLAIPAYINAFTYGGILDYTGPVQVFFRNYLHINGSYSFFDIMNIKGAIFVMTMALYPYVYIPVKSSLLQQSSTINDTAKMFGVSRFKLFYKVTLPLIRPALAGGGVLVLMEVLNEYGAVHYFGVNTLTVGIFRSWFALGDLNGAMKLSAYLLLGVLIIVFGEKIMRKRMHFSMGAPKPFFPHKIKGLKAFLAILICFIPLSLGFLLPVLQLLWWVIKNNASFVSNQFVLLVRNSFLLSGLSSVLIIFVAIFTAHILRNKELKGKQFFSSVLNLGYAVPGTVIAISIMISLGFVDKTINKIFIQLFSHRLGLIFSGSIVALVLAYTIRYLAVAFNPIDAGFTQINGNIHEASRTLGSKPLKSLLTVDLPNISSSLKGASLLLFIDLMKELPLTMILRPFNLDTLAIKAYELASDERLSAAAYPSVIIIVMGLLPVLLLSRNMRNKGQSI